MRPPFSEVDMNATIHKAEKTLRAIENMLRADQGAKYRTTLATVLPHIGDAYRGEDGGFRSHLGASVLGQECGRAIYYGFRWFTQKTFDGRILRLFNRGHLEEGRFIALLIACGIKVYQQDANGKQFRIQDFGGHLGGSGDGVAIGVPDVDPDSPVLLEFKTHNDKSFVVLAKEGVRYAKPEHYIQMQMYMQKMGIPVALYMAVNKNTDAIWAEIVTVNPELALQYVDRAGRIIFAKEPPKRINESPGWFACKFCDHRDVCHLGADPARNCRTCTHSIPRENGDWSCGFSGQVLTKEDQHIACDKYEAI